MKLWKALPVGLLAAAATVGAGIGPASAAAQPAAQVHSTAVVANGAVANGKVKAFTVKTTAQVFAETGVVPSAVEPLDTWYCWDNIVIVGHNGDYVSAQMDYTGTGYAMLRARATAVGPWELFGTCRDQNTGSTFLWSEDNGDYVSAEMTYTGGSYAMLRARATAVGPWESFYTPNNPGDGATFFESEDNGDFVSAELNYTGSTFAELRARATSVGIWETFAW